MCTVRDTGVGMSADVRARLFEPFFTTKELGRGTGLGLAEVYGTARAHLGGVHVESDVGRGSTFSLYLPAGAATERAPDARLPAIAAALRVLVVDDERGVRRSACRLLRQAGHEVVAD